MDLSGQYENWNGSRVAGGEELINVLISFSKHLITTGVRAKGQ